MTTEPTAEPAGETASPDLGIFIDPPSHHFLGDRLFDPAGVRFSGDDLLAPHRAVRDYFAERGVPVHTADALLDARDDGSKRLYVSLGYLGHFRRLARRGDIIPSAFFAFECPIVDPGLYRALPAAAASFKRVFSWGDADDLRRFTRGRRLELERFWWPQSFDEPHEDLWRNRDRQFLVMINANKLPRVYWRELYTKRVEAVAYFQQFGEIDLFGKHWDDIPRRVGNAWIPAVAKRAHEQMRRQWRRIVPHPGYERAAQAHRGPAESKSETLSRYTFALCFENMVLDGWMTEKLFDCLFSGTIPIYWGASDVDRWIPNDCFIDFRRFEGFEDLREHLHGLSEADIEAYREAGSAFLRSPAFERFSKRAYVDIFRRLVEEDAGWRSETEVDDTKV